MATKVIPKNSITSTWRKQDPKTWTHFEKVTDTLDLHETKQGEAVPVHQKTDKMGYVPAWEFHRFILLHALWPLGLQYAATMVTGYQFSALAAWGFYSLAFILNGIWAIKVIRALGHKCGFLDGDKHERDGVPDNQAGKIIVSLVMTATLRPLLCSIFAWDGTKSPLTISPWILVEIGAYQVALDFWYYWYHRILHENDFLWKYHQKHHITKHPNPLLTLYADQEQELFDIIVIPFLTYATLRFFGLPMGFYEWWICHQYVVTSELWGHSGVRVYITPATTATPLLKLFSGELTIEDHDLHHRQGWKKSHNYGKQTCLWDTIFGTKGKRIEIIPQNIDWNDRVSIPLF